MNKDRNGQNDDKLYALEEMEVLQKHNESKEKNLHKKKIIRKQINRQENRQDAGKIHYSYIARGENSHKQDSRNNVYLPKDASRNSKKGYTVKQADPLLSPENESDSGKTKE